MSRKIKLKIHPYDLVAEAVGVPRTVILELQKAEVLPADLKNLYTNGVLNEDIKRVLEMYAQSLYCKDLLRIQLSRISKKRRRYLVDNCENLVRYTKWERWVIAQYVRLFSEQRDLPPLPGDPKTCAVSAKMAKERQVNVRRWNRWIYAKLSAFFGIYSTGRYTKAIRELREIARKREQRMSQKKVSHDS